MKNVRALIEKWRWMPDSLRPLRGKNYGEVCKQVDGVNHLGLAEEVVDFFDELEAALNADLDGSVKFSGVLATHGDATTYDQLFQVKIEHSDEIAKNQLTRKLGRPVTCLLLGGGK